MCWTAAMKRVSSNKFLQIIYIYMYIYIINMNKPDLPLNNLQWLILHKTKQILRNIHCWRCICFCPVFKSCEISQAITFLKLNPCHWNFQLAKIWFSDQELLRVDLLQNAEEHNHWFTIIESLLFFDLTKNGRCSPFHVKIANEIALIIDITSACLHQLMSPVIPIASFGKIHLMYGMTRVYIYIYIYILFKLY